ncbi:hypothetical protein J2Z76_002754 [Sedimentibacter acidaminivorans]|jgi:ABC-3C protein|uniref:ABC-three component systems C-terminal domain-containing protein n=1 Tax=Sedimentibacter acidaminivorans TaxID=913099 RepID=A0ABS4GGR5_9FIRM|nr:ABC-three component system protein [Sedimentibacter acidaminivorans]MBP1926884.1 hypothetical protein [Sedimentibacter acidaminivorans]
MQDYYKKQLIKILLDNKLYKCDGTDFQKFVNQIFTYKNENFTPVKPQGNIGDRGNDGYIYNAGVYLQVYGPEDLSNIDTQKYAIAKYEKDFLKLLNHISNAKWPAIKKFIYVINDKSYGFFPDLLILRDNLYKSHPEIKFDIYGNDQLRNIILSLPLEHQEDLLGSIYEIEDYIDILDANILDKTIKAIIDDYKIPYTINGNPLKVPNWDRKIAFNKLKCKPPETKLIEGYYNIDKIDAILNDDNKPETDEALSTIVKTIYNESVIVYPKSEEDQFFYIFNQLMDKVKTNRTISDISKSSAIFCIMSKYFEVCDIFKEPPEDYKIAEL